MTQTGLTHVSTGLREFRPLARYPHMSQADIPVWTRFLKRHPTFFDLVEYDVRVGAGRGAPGGSDAGG